MKILHDSQKAQKEIECTRRPERITHTHKNVRIHVLNDGDVKFAVMKVALINSKSGPCTGKIEKNKKYPVVFCGHYRSVSLVVRANVKQNHTLVASRARHTMGGTEVRVGGGEG